MPPIKQKARFKIKDAKCHLKPRNKEKHRDATRQTLQGEALVFHPHVRVSSRSRPPAFTLGGQFPCTDDCQVTFVNFKCDSSKKRRRGRKSPSKEVSHITAEFEMEMTEDEASGAVRAHVQLREGGCGGADAASAPPQTCATWTASARR